LIEPLQPRAYPGRDSAQTKIDVPTDRAIIPKDGVVSPGGIHQHNCYLLEQWAPHKFDRPTKAFQTRHCTLLETSQLRRYVVGNRIKADSAFFSDNQELTPVFDNSSHQRYRQGTM
jgi:hypothetical protein